MTMLIRIGFTGSREGMTTPQMRAVYGYLANVLIVNDNDPDIDGIEFHHGDCEGSDAEAHVIATVLGCRTVAHPPLLTIRRAWCRADEIRPPKGYLDRDYDITQETGELLAAPKTPEPYPLSGTWTTTGYAVRAGRPAKVFLPDGTMRAGSDLLRGGLTPGAICGEGD